MARLKGLEDVPFNLFEHVPPKFADVFFAERVERGGDLWCCAVGWIVLLGRSDRLD